MINVLLDDIKLVKKMSTDLYKQGILSIKPYDNEVQLNVEAFHRYFKDYTAVPFSNRHPEYPLQIEKEIDGLKFYALLDKEEAEREAAAC